MVNKKAISEWKSNKNRKKLINTNWFSFQSHESVIAYFHVKYDKNYDVPEPKLRKIIISKLLLYSKQKALIAFICSFASSHSSYARWAF